MIEHTVIVGFGMVGHRTATELLDRDPAGLAFARRCTTCGSEQHGKPSLRDVPDWHFSLSYTSASAIVAVSNGMRADILRAYPQVDPERVKVVHNGIDLDAWAPRAGVAANTANLERSYDRYLA